MRRTVLPAIVSTPSFTVITLGVIAAVTLVGGFAVARDSGATSHESGNTHPGTAVRESGADDGTMASASAAADLPSEEAVRHFFRRFESLKGRWRASSSKGWADVVTYEVIASGSAVMSTTHFADAPERTMVTMFTIDDGRLVATHYCESGNQPRLVAEALDPGSGRAEFRFAGGGNLADRNRGHMDRAQFEFVDENRFRSRWTWYQGGEERWLEEIELTRIR